MSYDSYMGYNSYNLGGLFGALAGMMIFAIIISLAITVFSIIIMWKIFKKAGKEGWIALIPLYNVYTLFEITWGKGWYCLLLLLSIIPILGWIADIAVIIITMIKLSKAFGKDSGFTVGLVLLNFIFLAILAFDKSTYLGVPTKDGNNMQPAGPQPNQFQSVGNGPVNPTPMVEPQMTQQQMMTPQDNIPNEFQYNTPSQEVDSQTNNLQSFVETTTNEVNNVVPPVTAPTNQQSFCANCGAQLPEGTIFCPNCGTPKAS